MPSDNTQDTTPPSVHDQTVVMHFGEPAPTPNTEPAIYDLVIRDMAARDRFGHNKYGTRLQPFNGRDALKDAYEEVLDLAVYLRQLIYERDRRTQWMATGEQNLPPVVRSEQVNPFRTQQMTLFHDPDKTLKLHPDWTD